MIYLTWTNVKDQSGNLIGYQSGKFYIKIQQLNRVKIVWIAYYDGQKISIPCKKLELAKKCCEDYANFLDRRKKIKLKKNLDNESGLCFFWKCKQIHGAKAPSLKGKFSF